MKLNHHFLLPFIIWILSICKYNVIINAEKIDDNNGTVQTTNNNYSVCNSTICKNAAELIIKGRNESVEPCNDFYSYVCSNWSTNYPISDNLKFINLHTMTVNKFKPIIKEILQKRIDQNDSLNLRYEKKWFQSCNNEERILNIGQNLLINITEKIGGIPMAMDFGDFSVWLEKHITWQNVNNYYTRLIGESVFFKLELSPNGKDFKYFISKPSTNDIDDKSKIIFNYFTEKGKLNISWIDLEEVLTFHKKLNMAIDDETSRVEQEMTIEKFQEKYNIKCPRHSNGRMNFSKTFSILLKEMKLSKNETIQIHSLYFIMNLCYLFKHTSSRIIVNYIHWRFLVDSFDYWYVKKDLLSNKSRSDECLSLLLLKKGHITELFTNYLPKNTMDLTNSMFYNIRVYLYTKLLNSQWLNTKDLFMNYKLANMKFLISNNYNKDMILNEETEFSNYTFKITSNFLQNWINFKKSNLLNIKQQFEEAKKHNIKKRSIYFPSKNLLKISFAEVASLLFNEELPNATNYGNLGFNIGHGMARAFGRLSRKNDEIMEPGKWTKEMIKNQMEKLKCFENDFMNDSIYKNIITESNFVDSVGLNIAFETYQNYINDNKIIDPKLPGLEDFNDNKLFFTSFAMNFCENITPEAANERNEISSTSDRVNLAVSNSDGFADTFNCKEGDILWKKEKCAFF
ncbi:neprilysin-1-like isoform X2 [Leptopilina boulardi]|uniref:neprilysin-1-like isoform X2 n=1 Tax=Leptopilina boulardi TaxID=63433 RepID=UPI0021F5AE26|nr:neprilysin-1-like isoform X2 [Leptopilina boulardi]